MGLIVLLQCTKTLQDLGAHVIRHWSGAELVLIAMHGAAGALPALRHSHAVREGLGRLPRQLQLLGKCEPLPERCLYVMLPSLVYHANLVLLQVQPCPRFWMALW